MKPRQISGKNYIRRARGRNAGGGIAGPSIQLSNATILDDASIGDLVGTLSVIGGVGTYVFTLTSNPGSSFSITGSSLKVAAALSAGSDAITVHADNGAGSTIDRAFLITVVHDTFVPTTPILAITSPSTQANPAFTIDVDDTVVAGDTVRLQVQVTGGNWSSPISDTTHTITSGEDSANEIDLSLSALANATYDARALVHHTTDSAWSNVVTFTIAAVAVSNNRISSAGNRRISSAGNGRIWS